MKKSCMVWNWATGILFFILLAITVNANENDNSLIASEDGPGAAESVTAKIGCSGKSQASDDYHDFIDAGFLAQKNKTVPATCVEIPDGKVCSLLYNPCVELRGSVTCPRGTGPLDCYWIWSEQYCCCVAP